GALSAVLVPTFVDLFRADDDAEAERLASGVLGMALAVMTVVSILGIVLAPAIARLLSTGAPNAHVESQQVALSTFFLRFFIPQVLLYAVGTVATAVLFAKRRFVIVAVAPIANTVVLVTTMIVFRIMHGPTPDLDLTTPEKLVLAIGGTLGVLGFVGVPTVALLRSGFRLRATLGTVDRKLRRLLSVGNSRHDYDLFAAVLASLGVGLFTYGTFLFFARASYALGDSRTPAIIAGACAVVGAGVMVVGGLTFDSDTAKVAALGLGHSAAYLLGTLVLGFVLRRRIGHGFFPHAFLPALAASAALGGLAWLVEDLVAPK